jgi:SAM-dependent methyltransferase
MTDIPYTDAFFEMHEDGSRTSARETVPVVMELVGPSSVVDVGCGIGTWLVEFQAAGVRDYLGVDGDYVNRDKLLIVPERFLARDLAQPFDVGRRFDLAVSLEVAEHLPPESAETFVASLTALAPVVLFSAAIPEQWGDGHINEQWPSYWQQRFASHGYVVVDCLRWRVWESPAMMPWYAQNMMFFVQRDRIGEFPRLASAFERAGEHPPLDIVHPNHYLNLVSHLTKRLQALQRTATRSALRLREINLVAFPDWSQSAPRIHEQLRSLLAALMSHPDCDRMAIVIDTAHERQELAGNMVTQVTRELFSPGGVPIAQGPNVSVVGRAFDREQWDILLEFLHWRVVLDDENPSAIAAAGANKLKSVSLETLKRKEALGKS